MTFAVVGLSVILMVGFMGMYTIKPAVVSWLTIKCQLLQYLWYAESRPHSSARRYQRPRSHSESLFALESLPSLQYPSWCEHLSSVCFSRFLDEFCSLEALIMLKSQSIVAMSVTAVMYAVRESFYNCREAIAG